MGVLAAQDQADGVGKIYSLLSRAQAVAVVDELQMAAQRKLVLDEQRARRR